jgi:transcription elongation factor
MALDMSPEAVALRQRKYTISKRDILFYDAKGQPISHEEMTQRAEKLREAEASRKKGQSK